MPSSTLILIAILFRFLSNQTESEMIRASRYPFSLYLSITLSKSFTYLLRINFEAFKIRNLFICLVSLIALRNLPSENFSFPSNVMLSILILSPLSILITRLTLLPPTVSIIGLTTALVLK